MRDSFENEAAVASGRQNGEAVIFLVRAQALNFQIATTNKCCVDKRGKIVPIRGKENESRKREDKKRKKDV